MHVGGRVSLVAFDRLGLLNDLSPPTSTSLTIQGRKRTSKVIAAVYVVLFLVISCDLREKHEI